MSKTVLGRGLGSLLGADKIAGKSGSAAIPAAVPPPPTIPGRGVGTLLQGAASVAPAAPATAAEPVQTVPVVRPRLKPVPVRSSGTVASPRVEPKPVVSLRPQWRYLGADLVLLLLAGLVVSSRTASLDWTQVLLIAILVGGGAVLACLPLVESLGKISGGASAVSSKWVLAHGPHPGECFVVHLQEPNFVARVDEIGKKMVLVPMSPSVWIQIPRRVSDRLKREALAFFESQRAKPDTIATPL